eukprot:gene26320-28802_t
MEFQSGLFLDAQMVRMLVFVMAQYLPVNKAAVKIGISLGASEGDECGIRKGCCDGHPDGVISGDKMGREDGPKLGLFDGLLVGLKLDDLLGRPEGKDGGLTVGSKEWCCKGSNGGFDDGVILCFEVKASDGHLLGNSIGFLLGIEEGKFEGQCTGQADGRTDGSRIGYGSCEGLWVSWKEQ